MTFEENLDAFQDNLDNIVDIQETCEVCGCFLYDEFGRPNRRAHMECRRILAMEKGCD